MNIQPTVTDLVHNAAKLSTKELENLLQQLSIIRLRRSGAKVLDFNESELLQSLNDAFPLVQWERMKLLDEKSEFEKLSKKEEAELLQLSEAYEAASLTRLQILLKLASLHNTTIEAVANQLGIKPNYHA
ncbi:MAG: hypothetical protein K9J37_16865 [Saprospiraceae bacterium]|nr:hypothetical protein [Saprospiraceae bacterium]MCF8251588.1 hypothetical protein [Saprospiraceae bacterium]MCF8282050.1 hypothetical protein [Bacteroidales bacterium]MCF8313483.1 hypothetical protein [Saprospiraceae bacterium]MCF8442224.1 hypothetical protein [Saprospiraceae bacterium]